VGTYRFTLSSTTLGYYEATLPNGLKSATLSPNTGRIFVYNKPTDISLDNTTIMENKGVNAIVGSFTTTDPNVGDTFTYTLVSGTGDTDNASFNILGSTLRANNSFNYETKSSYSIRVRSTDQRGLYFEKQFTVTVTGEPGSMNTPFEIIQGQFNPHVLSLPNNSTLYFSDSQYPSLVSLSTLYRGNGATGIFIDTSGVCISVTSPVTNKNIIFSPISASTMTSLNITRDFAMIFKVFDNSGTIINSINPPLSMDIFLDNYIGPIVNLFVGATGVAGSGTYQGQVATGDKKQKHVYSVNLTRGDGAVEIQGSLSNPSAGSDPHITTIFGKKYLFHPSSRKTYTLFKSNDIKVTSHFTGIKTGVYYDNVMIDLPNKDHIKIDFHKHQIKGKSSLVSISEKECLPSLKYNNMTSVKSLGNIFTPNSMTKVSVSGKNPVDLFVDFQTRYVHFRFPNVLPKPNEMSGLIVVDPTSRLD
jgi:hypothetical protein